MDDALTKAIVLARGLGTRMRRADAGAQLNADQSRAADAGLKPMISVGRPFLDYVLSGLADAGVHDICLVIGPEHGQVREYYDAQTLRRIALSYAIQLEARGTADALIAGKPFAAGRQFVVLNSDNYYPVSVLRTLAALDGPGTVLFEREGLINNSNIPAERIRKYAYAEVVNGALAGLIEKPDLDTAIPPGALVSMNIWRFAGDIFEHCRSVERSPRGEYELPAAVDRAVQHGMRLRVERSHLGVLDLSERADVAAVAERLRGVEVVL
jgi:glucose-1-phosphate thymidylyltransferase